MRIIFVCMGNTCRSPIAEAFLQNKLDNLKITNVKTESAGMACEFGTELAQNSKTIIEAKQIFYTHTSRPLAKINVNCEDIIITMERWQVGVLKEFLKLPKIHCIDDFTGEGDIVDPYGMDFAEYQNVADKLDFAIDTIIEKLDLKNVKDGQNI